jgi:hypothetical protein
MGAVDGDTVKAKAFGADGGAGKGLDDGIDIALRHGAQRPFADDGGGDRELVRIGGQLRHTAKAGMPELGKHPAAGLVHRIDHLFPAGQRGLPIEIRNPVGVMGDRMVHRGAFGDDQPGAACGPADIIIGHAGVQYAPRRKAAGHRRHHDAVLQNQVFDLQAAE